LLFIKSISTTINLDRYCSDQDTEACIIQLDSTYAKIVPKDETSVVLNRCVVYFICSDDGNSLKSCQ